MDGSTSTYTLSNSLESIDDLSKVFMCAKFGRTDKYSVCNTLIRMVIFNFGNLTCHRFDSWSSALVYDKSLRPNKSGHVRESSSVIILTLNLCS